MKCITLTELIEFHKRIGVSTMILLSKLNNIKLEFTQKELIDFGISVAEGKYLEEDIFNWIINHKI